MNDSTKRILLNLIFPNPEQPRKAFDQSELEELAASIREHDVIVPVVVEEAGMNYILHDGERRIRAAKLAGLVDIPVSIVPPLNGTSKQDRLTRAVVANVQRADMNPIEEAKAYQRMRDEFGWNANEISRRTGVYQVKIYNMLNLTRLEPEIQQLIADGKLGHDHNMVRAFLEIPGSKERVSLVLGLASRGTTVKGCILAAKRLKEVLESEIYIRDKCPAMKLASQNADVALDHEPTRWSAMQELGTVPPWGMVSKIASDTCNACELKDMASSAVCGRCQLVDMLRRLMEAAK